MKLTRVLAAVGLISVAGATAARADFKDFSNRCTPGAIQACWSLQVFTTLNISGGTNVTILVRNLQGTIPYPADNTGGSLIQRIGLVAPTITGASGLTVGTAAGAGVVGSPASTWVLRNPGGLGGLIELTAGTNVPTTDGGIAGCNAPAGGYPASYFSTCGGGWVVLSFTTSNAWSADNATVAVLTTDIASAPGLGIECDTDQNPTPRAECVVATPEPVTMILLGSGLAGMGGFGFARRRRGNDVISD